MAVKVKGAKEARAALVRAAVKLERTKHGKLREIVVTEKTRLRYRRAVSNFVVEMEREGLGVPNDLEELDALLAAYLEKLYQGG